MLCRSILCSTLKGEVYKSRGMSGRYWSSDDALGHHFSLTILIWRYYLILAALMAIYIYIYILCIFPADIQPNETRFASCVADCLYAAYLCIYTYSLLYSLQAGFSCSVFSLWRTWERRVSSKASSTCSCSLYYFLVANYGHISCAGLRLARRISRD